jgi:hypothetical protein
MFVARGYAQADADLTVGDLSRQTSVLSPNANRVVALLDEARVVDNPCIDWAPLRHRVQCVTGSGCANISIGPPRIGNEVEQALMHGISAADALARAACDRLSALALTVTKDSHRIDGERLAAAG